MIQRHWEEDPQTTVVKGRDESSGAEGERKEIEGKSQVSGLGDRVDGRPLTRMGTQKGNDR